MQFTCSIACNIGTIVVQNKTKIASKNYFKNTTDIPLYILIINYLLRRLFHLLLDAIKNALFLFS
jgi:hypothetical protein